MASSQYSHPLLLLLATLLLLTSPHLSLSQSQISLPPAFPPTSSSSSSSTLSGSHPLAPSPHVSDISDSPSLSPPAVSPSTDDDGDGDGDGDEDFIHAPAPAPLSSSSSSVTGTLTVPVPVPAPSHLEVKASSAAAEEAEVEEEKEKRALNGGKKAGVVVGVFAAAALVGLGVLVCKKRQENIRRSRYGGYSSRVELI